MKILNYRLVIFILSIIFGVFFSMPSFLQTDAGKKISLGLDLQGGLHMLLGVKTDEAVVSKIKSIASNVKYFTDDEEILIEDLTINHDSVHFLVLDPDEVNRMDKMLGEIKGLIVSKSEDNNYTLTLTEEEIALTKDQAVSQAVETIRNRLDQFGLAEPSVIRQGTTDIVVELPGIKTQEDEKAARELISKPANLELMAIDEERADQVYTMSKAQAAQYGNIILEDAKDPSKKYLVKEIPILNGSQVTDAQVAFDQSNQAIINFTLNTVGARVFGDFTAKSVGKRLAIVLDGKVYSAPNIRERIGGGSGQISGGFFIGIFWFYWVSLSFRYYELSYLIPIVILFFALAYGFLFLITSIKDNIYIRAILFFALSFLNPFGFDWFKSEILLLDTYFEANKILLALIILSTIFLIKRKFIIYTFCIIIISFININPKNNKVTNLKISLPEYYFEQNYKWERKNLAQIIDKNFEQINKAIQNKDEVVVLAETTFPFTLNKQDFIMQNLIEKSRFITIITGGLYFEKGEYKNSTYIFKDGLVKMAHKVVLVPFGEAVPFPEKIKNLINDIFYDGAKDYTKASKPTDYKIKDTLFRNAICYEATSEEIYQNLGEVKHIIAISNDAWFTPSTQPTLQKLLLRLYSKKYAVTIYHQINGVENYIIKAD